MPLPAYQVRGIEASTSRRSSVADLRAPFPWFGGKSKVAPLVWERFWDVDNYVEPFFGSGAVLLGRPTPSGIETINDKDCFVANFWRALQHDPEAVTHYADWPVNEADQHARHLWLVNQADWAERMKSEPEYFDTKVAGWWVWGQSIWIGSGWCSALESNAGTGVHRKRPHLGNAGKGINRQLPHLGDAGTGVHRQLPHLGDAGTGVHRKRLLAYMLGLSERLRAVRVCCGEWSRVLGPSPTVKLGITGVFLDPPYADAADRTERLYASDDLSVAHSVREWAISHADDSRMRIALCGYEGEHDMPSSWDCVQWKARGGYGSQGEGTGRDNSHRERIWFSPYCLRPQEMFDFKPALPLETERPVTPR